MDLDIRKREDCRWDIVSLGEVLLRFDPGDERIHTARTFRVWEGGGEYNVARGLSKTYRQRAAVVTAFADNQLGRLAEDLVNQGGVDTSLIRWKPTDGIGRETRNGMYFMERGFGQRAPVGCSDRANTAVSQLTAGDIDWAEIFSQGVRWFHTGGIFAGLSDTSPDVAFEAMTAAKAAGTCVSFDLNYRDSLWAGRGGRDASDEVSRRLLPMADVVFGVEGYGLGLDRHADETFRIAAAKMFDRFPDLSVAATTLRRTRSASLHDLGAIAYCEGKLFFTETRNDVDVLDRVGSGDAFDAGFIYGILEARSLEDSLALGLAGGVLAMSTPGDGSSATLAEIERLIDQKDAAAIR